MKKKYFTELPVWIDVKTWEDYQAMRKALRKPMTARAIELTIEKLGDMKEEGQDPNRILEQSIMHSWIGVFPIRESGRQSFNGRGPMDSKDAFSKTLKNFGLSSGRS